MKLGILITTYNRPAYLRRCLQSIAKAEIPPGTEILIVDDASTDPQVREILHNEADFANKHFMPQNRSIKYSMLKGCETLFSVFDCDAVTNLDADAIVRRDFISVLLGLKERFPEHIITGFNCLTRNLNGSERHKVLMHGDNFNAKQSVGGINMLFDRVQYVRWIKPALEQCLQAQGNWDHQACILSMSEGKQIICSVPSVVQHIGTNSAMGHALTEPPDVADDFDNRLKLPMVTLAGADCVNLDRLQRAADISCTDIQFGDVKLFSNFAGPRVTRITPMVNKSQYSEFMIKELGRYITTSHVLVIQYDGFVLNAQAWQDSWLEYDYIGAPWEWYTDGMNVGNGGFSLRSKKLQDILASDPTIVPINDPVCGTRNKEEDHCICRLYRPYLQSRYGIKYASVQVARKFSIEGWNAPNKTWNGEFGFHGRVVDLSNATKIIL